MALPSGLAKRKRRRRSATGEFEAMRQTGAEDLDFHLLKGDDVRELGVSGGGQDGQERLPEFGHGKVLKKRAEGHYRCPLCQPRPGPRVSGVAWR